MLAKAGRSLVIDAGNALFSGAVPVDEAGRQRAAFVMRTMGALGTKVMAVGHKDLVAGVEFLTKEAAAAGVSLLSANARVDGAAPFAGSTTVTVGGVKVALVGLLPKGPVPGLPGLGATSPTEALTAELARLGKRDLTVVLATTSYVDALALAGAGKGQVDLVIQSGEYRGATAPQNIDGVFVLSSGQKGQVVGKVELQLAGEGALLDLGDNERLLSQLAFLDGQLDVLKKRVAAARDAQARAELDGTVREMTARRAELRRSIDAPTKPGKRSLKHTWVMLGADVADDPALKAQVLRIEPTYAGGH